VSPRGWAWGGPTTAPVDAVLLLYAADGPSLEALYDRQSRRMEEHGVTQIVRLDTSDLDGVEPFGFRDGVSQPIVEGLAKAGRADNTVRAGEFVLGYPNEYGRYTSRPVLAADQDPDRILPRDPAGSKGRDLGRNGSYLVFRQLAQDVPAFWQFVDRAAASAEGASDPAARVRLAAKMVGRWPSGAPLGLAPVADDPSLADVNDFGYFHEDPHGERCPIGAHVRRANPRDSLDPNPGSPQSIAIGNRHRLLRRGREYGPPSGAGQAPGPPAGNGRAGEHGLHFLCLNANISRQFEFVQHTWLNNPTFAGLRGEPDPLVSPHGRDEYRIPGRPVRTRLTGLPRFVTVRGGAYFFLPGLRAIRYLANRAGAGGW
jgi:Dyp-type peroxidase family